MECYNRRVPITVRGVLAVSVFYLAACAASKPVAPAAPPAFKLLQSYACPYPAERGLITVHADGKVSYTIFEGLDGPPRGKSIRQKKRLSLAEVEELSALMARSDFQSMPERAQSFPPRYEHPHACSRSLEFSSGGEGKTVHYRDGDVPEPLASLLQDINAVLDRYSWEEDFYPWEKR